MTWNDEFLDYWFPEAAQKASELLDSATPFFVVGPPGIGKTRFLSNLVFNPQVGIPVEWVNLATADPLSVINTTIQLFTANPPAQEVTVLLDGADVFSDMGLGDIIQRLREFKHVKNVIATSRRSSNFPGIQEIVLTYREGELYALKDQVVVAPHHGIIKAVAPTIVTTNDTLIERLKLNPVDLFTISPRQFEEVIADLLYGMGLEVELTPATRDGGKDMLAYIQTPVGKLLTLVEAKRHDKNRPVGVSLVRSLYGTVVDHQASSGMLVTTSRFAKPARQFQEKHKYQLELKDYEDVVSWLMRHKT